MSRPTVGAAAPPPVWDLDVRVGLTEADGGGRTAYRVTVSYAYDRITVEKSAPFAPPMTAEELRRFAGLLERSRVRGITRTTTDTDGPSFLDETERLGQRLFDALFTGPTLEGFATSVANARFGGARLRIRLRLADMPDLARLPWELLRNGEFLAVTDRQFVARFVGASRDVARPALAGALRVLVVAASPTSWSPLSLDAEYGELVRALGQPVADGSVELHRLASPTLPALQDALAQPWHVLHVIGHGEDRGDGGTIVLEHADRSAHEIEADILGHHLARATHLRLVVLNGCRTGTVPWHQPHRGAAARLVAGGVPTAVAMQYPVADTNAVRFAARLYETLATGEYVDRAVAEARLALLHTPDWVNPVLYLCSDGRLFDAPAPPPPTPRHALAPAARVPTGLLPPPERFTPRPWLVEEVDAWLSADARVLVLTGDLGMGKSVASAWLAGAGDPPPQGGPAAALARVRAAWSAVAFCSSSLVGGTTSARAFVVQLSEQLAHTVPGFVVATGSADAVPADLVREGAGVDELFARAVEDPLRAALRAPGAQPAVVLVDGLDEATGPGQPTILDLVARLARLDLPVRLMLCGPDDAEVLRPVTTLRGVSVHRIDLSRPAYLERCRADVRAFLDRAVLDTTLAAGTDPDAVERLRRRIAEHADGNFLYAENVVATLEAPAETDAGPDAGPHVPPTLSAVYDLQLRQVLQQAFGDRWRDEWIDRMSILLGFLAVARAPVPTAALQAWTGWTRPRLTAMLDACQQLVRSEDGFHRLYHRGFAAHLRGSTGAARLGVDEDEADREIVRSTADLTAADLARAADIGGSYRLVHAPDHLARLRDAGTGADLLDPLLARMRTPEYLTALEACVTDPVLIGEPYRMLAGILLAEGRWADVESVVTHVAGADASAVRACVFDVLLAYADRQPRGATSFMTRLALGDDVELATSALHATSRLPAAAQAHVFRRVVSRGDEALRLSAGYALVANGAPDPQKVLRDVLSAVLRDLPLATPWRLRAPLEFFTHVTVTNYIMRCHEPVVTRLTADLFRELLVDRLHATVVDYSLLERLAIEPFMARRLSDRVLALVTGPAAPDGSEQVGADVPGAAEARRLLAALDPDVSLAPYEDDLRALLDADAVLLRVLATLAVGVHAVAQPDATAPLVRRLAAELTPRARRWLLLAHAVILPTTPSSWIPVLEELTQSVLADGVARGETLVGIDTIDLVHVPLGLAYAKAQAPMAAVEALLRSGSPEHQPWRAVCLTGLGAVGLARPDAVLATLHHLRRAGALDLGAAVPALALMAGVHPLQVRSWVLTHGDRSLLTRVEGRTDVPLSRRYLEVLGHYNNAAHQMLYYPKLRRRLGVTVFSHFLDSRSRKQWSRKYTREALTMLRDVEYDLMRLVD